MKREAITKAERRLEAARAASDAIQCADDPNEIESEWAKFVLAVGGWYSILEQGAKGNGPSQGWFGKLKSERKKDDLLRYIHYARNSEEHGIKPHTHRGHQYVELGPGATATIYKKSQYITELVESSGPIRFFGPENVALDTVLDERYGDTCDIPKSHRGTAIDPTPANVAKLCVQYLVEMTEKAKKLADP